MKKNHLLFLVIIATFISMHTLQGFSATDLPSKKEIGPFLSSILLGNILKTSTHPKIIKKETLEKYFHLDGEGFLFNGCDHDNSEKIGHCLFNNNVLEDINDWLKVNLPSWKLHLGGQKVLADGETPSKIFNKIVISWSSIPKKYKTISGKAAEDLSLILNEMKENTTINSLQFLAQYFYIDRNIILVENCQDTHMKKNLKRHCYYNNEVLTLAQEYFKQSNRVFKLEVIKRNKKIKNAAINPLVLLGISIVEINGAPIAANEKTIGPIPSKSQQARPSKLKRARTYVSDLIRDAKREAPELIGEAATSVKNFLNGDLGGSSSFSDSHYSGYSDDYGDYDDRDSSYSYRRSYNYRPQSYQTAPARPTPVYRQTTQYRTESPDPLNLIGNFLD